jgi:hypothetical protein
MSLNDESINSNLSENKNKKIIRKYITIQTIFESYILNPQQYNNIVKYWWDTEKEQIKEWFDDIDDIHDISEEIYQEFVEFCFNSWDDNYNFYYHHNIYIDGYSVSEFIELFTKCQKWFKDELDTEISIINNEHAWNTIVYWIVKETDLFKDKISEFLEEIYKDYLETKRPSRIACGVCYDNKILYTGCSACNNNYICKECYESLENENECPYCRCKHMILFSAQVCSAQAQVSYNQEQIDFKSQLMFDLKLYTENEVNE